MQNNKPLVLLVEDYEANVMVAGFYLDDFGYQYHVAVNGNEAISMALATQYAAILMDVQMPGVNGFEATRQIRDYEKIHNTGPVPIIGMTAHALAGDRERCLSSGMDEYITKPINADELKQKLDSFTKLVS